MFNFVVDVETPWMFRFILGSLAGLGERWVTKENEIGVLIGNCDGGSEWEWVSLEEKLLLCAFRYYDIGMEWVTFGEEFCGHFVFLEKRNLK